MSKIQQIADALLAQEKSFRAVLSAGEFLREIGNIENLEQEHRAREAQARDAATVAQDLLERVRGKVAEEKAQLELIRAAAKQALADADAEGARILANAEAEVVARQEAAQLALDAVHQSTRTAQNEARQLEEQLAATRAEYDDLKAKLDALRSTAASIAGR